MRNVSRITQLVGWLRSHKAFCIPVLPLEHKRWLLQPFRTLLRP